MKRFAILTFAAVAAATVALSLPADAKRIGGGGSLGAQRSAIAPKAPTAAPAPGAAAQPVMPATAGAAAAAKPAMAAAPAAASGMSKWMGPIAGIAAGLGIAALLSHFGLPEGLGSFLLLALAAIAIVFIVRMFLARRTQASAPLQYAGGRPEPTVRSGPPDAPAWGSPAKQEPVMPAAAPAARTFPPGFDAVGFANQAKTQFSRLQAAYDTGDRQTMSEVMTPEMFAEVTRELGERGDHRPTEIVSLHAGVLEVATEGAAHWVSVRYTGLLREDGDSNPKPIDEVWNLTKPVNGSSGWMLAGIQQTA